VTAEAPSIAAAPAQHAAQVPSSLISRHFEFLNQPLYGDAITSEANEDDLAQLLNKYRVAGLSIGTLHNGLVGSTCRGLARREDLYNDRTATRSLPMQADTWVQVASLSKTVATAFAMEYLGKRGISFDTTVNQLLAQIGSNYRLQPAARTPTTWANEVQLRHLVNHTGLGMHFVYGFPPDKASGMPPMQDLMEGKHNYEPIFVSKKPNTKFAYSGGGFVMLQHICQTIAGSEQAFVEATRKFMDKCGMANEFSFVQETQAQQADAGSIFDMAVGYSDEGARVHSTGRLMFPGFAAGGHGTPRALARFLGHLAKAYKSVSGSGAISHQTAVSMLDQTSDCGARDFMNSLIGLGVFVATAGPNKFMIHQCANDGFRGLYMVCYDGPGAARGPNGFVLISNGDNGAVPLNCEVSKQLLQGCAEFDSGFDWGSVAGRDYNVEGVAQEQIVNAGLKSLVFDAMIDPSCGSNADSPVSASLPTHEAHKGKMRQAFNHFDLNKDGFLEPEELFWMGVALNHGSWTQQQNDELFCQIDANNAGQINFEEFCTALQHSLLNSPNHFNASSDELLHVAHDAAMRYAAHSVFKAIDTNGDGWLSHNEIKHACRRDPILLNRIRANGTRWKDVFDRMDVDGDQKVNAAEFAEYYASSPECSKAKAPHRSLSNKEKRERRLQSTK